MLDKWQPPFAEYAARRAGCLAHRAHSTSGIPLREVGSSTSGMQHKLLKLYWATVAELDGSLAPPSHD
jgi:hypothetical protein